MPSLSGIRGKLGLKKPPLRPATSVRNSKKLWNPGNAQSSESGLSIPTDVLLSAHKSKVLPFGPAMATNLIRSYVPMLGMAPSEKVGRTICTEYDVTSHDLTLFALVLFRSASPTSGPENARFARHLLATCSALSDPIATIELHKLLSRAQQSTFITMELKQIVHRLSRIAMKDQHPGALFRMGEVLESQSGKEAEAEECYRRAGEAGIGEAWVRLGRLQLKGGRKGEAEMSFEKGEALDNPHAYYYLAMYTGSSSPTHEARLLKAAASGVIEAAHNLGVYYQSVSPNPILAHEWYTLAATEGFALSQFNLAIILRDEGKLLAAVEWLAKAEKAGEGVEADAGRIRKEIEAKRLMLG